jgi:group II intron reverse transcriptase/maturase
VEERGAPEKRIVDRETQKDTLMSVKQKIWQEVSTKRQRIAQNARRMPEASFTALAHYIDLKWLYAAYLKTRKDAAPGIDGVQAGDYADNLGEWLMELLNRFKGGTYKAPPVRRVYLPKNITEKRPIGIPTFEDKVLQRAVTMVLEPLYEQEFYDCSYGFRPGRSPHQALQSLRNQIMELKGCWIIDLDIRKYFDSIDQKLLRSILRQRVCDGVITRMIDKWLKAGVMEEGKRYYPERGTPQGGVVSPLLSNIFLHEVLDRWFMETARKYLRGKAFLVRFSDAENVLKTLARRLVKYGLELHPEKTRLVDFRRPPKDRIYAKSKPGTFTFLGFTHYWGRSRNGNNVVRQKTAKERFSKAVQEINEWCRTHRHLKLKEQYEQLCLKVRGHYLYYGITGNDRALSHFRYEVIRRWRKWLNRRSRRRDLSWPKFARLTAALQLPAPRIYHSYYTAKL